MPTAPAATKRAKPSTTLQVARTVVVMQQFSCYATLAEVHRAVCQELGEPIADYSVRKMLKVFSEAGLVHMQRPSGFSPQFCWIGPCDLKWQQDATTKRLATPPASTTNVECVRQITDFGTTRNLPLEIPLEPVPANWQQFGAVSPAAVPVSISPAKKKWSRVRVEISREQVERAIAEAGSQSGAAKLLGVSATVVYRIVKQSGINTAAIERKSAKQQKAKRQPRRKPLPPPPAPREKAPPEPPRPARERKPRVHAAETLAGMHIDALWLLYKSDTTNTEVRNQLVDHYFYIVKTHAFHLANKLPDCALTAEEFYAPGVHGLISAMEGFDLDRGLKFPTYAVQRVVGAMKDELRELDWVPRLVRASQSKIARLTQKLDALPTAEQIAEEYDCDLAEAQRMLDIRVVGVESYNKTQHVQDDTGKESDSLSEIPDPRGCDPTRRLTDHDELRRLTRGLNKTERLVVILYYWEGQTMREIGEQVELSESRVSQMHSTILEKLRARLPDMQRAG